MMPNAAQQGAHGFMTGAPYGLAIVEFDDQGRCYDRGQMDGVAKRLDALAPDPEQAQDVILVVFVIDGGTTPARTTRTSPRFVCF